MPVLLIEVRSLAGCLAVYVNRKWLDHDPGAPHGGPVNVKIAKLSPNSYLELYSFAFQSFLPGTPV